METIKTEKGSVGEDLKLVEAISQGDGESWERFVRDFSGWAVYRSWKWCEQHCGGKSAVSDCGLQAVYGLTKGGGIAPSSRDECDEGMDTYIWIFEQLRKRVGRYSGRNNSRLSTFIWRILNSREFYIDWLRWKYGRVF